MTGNATIKKLTSDLVPGDVILKGSERKLADELEPMIALVVAVNECPLTHIKGTSITLLAGTQIIEMWCGRFYQHMCPEGFSL